MRHHCWEISILVSRLPNMHCHFEKSGHKWCLKATSPIWVVVKELVCLYNRTTKAESVFPSWKGEVGCASLGSSLYVVSGPWGEAWIGFAIWTDDGRNWSPLGRLIEGRMSHNWANFILIPLNGALKTVNKNRKPSWVLFLDFFFPSS